MSKCLVLLSAALLALPQAAALAEDGSEQYAPCVGPMCLLTPVWKFGTMLPDLTAKPKQSIPLQNVQPVSTNPINTSPAVAPNTAPAKSAEAGKPAESNAGQGDTGERDAGKKKLASLVRHSSYRFAYHFDAQHTRSSTRPASPTRPDNANATVTVAANETEIGRMLRLASVVTTPPIKVIPAPSYGCPERPADFVVDTMSNPRRVGPAIPLFTESLIIVARGDVKDLAGLRGRLVSFGLADSSSQQVADRTFRSLAIDVREQPLDLDNALDALALGDLDAIALLAPKGFERLAHHDPNFHLLALPDRFRPPDGLKLSGIDPSS